MLFLECPSRLQPAMSFPAAHISKRVFAGRLGSNSSHGSLSSIYRLVPQPGINNSIINSTFTRPQANNLVKRRSFLHTKTTIENYTSSIMAAPQPHIKLYTDSTPNGIKITTALEELGLKYEVEHVDISTLRQKEPWYLEINPNGRIPAIVDTFDDGEPIRVFEGGSILQYLTERYDTEHKLSFPKGSREYYECNNWLFFQHGGVGPMQGQASHFLKYAPVKIEYGVKRYVTETRRLYSVLDTQLSKSKSGYLVGDHLSIADIANLSWVIFGEYTDVDMNAFPHLKEWEARLSARPGISKGFHIPKVLGIKSDDPEGAQKYQSHHADWVIRSQQLEQDAFARK